MRDKRIDIMKGIGILFVIMGHTSSPISGYIYTFHMGLFFFITGYLSFGKANEKSAESLLDFTFQKAKSILIPYIVFWTISFVVWECLSRVRTGNFFSVEKNHILGLLLGGHWLADYSNNFPLWYFQMHFITVVLFKIILRLSAYIQTIILILLVVGTIPFQSIFPGRPVFHMNALPAALVFMIIGYKFGQVCSNYIMRKTWTFGIVLITIGWKVSTVYYGYISEIRSLLYYIGAFSTIIGIYYISDCFRGGGDSTIFWRKFNVYFRVTFPTYYHFL